MPTYEYGHAIVLARELTAAGVPQDVIDRIMEGGEVIGKRASPDVKAAWLAEAMRRMEALLDLETRRAVREACACCRTGQRGRMSRDLGKRGGSLEERIAAANDTPHVFGHSVELQNDGRILVRFSPEGRESYDCSCLPHATDRFPITYCYCCGGYVKHHLQAALGRKLSCETVTSALSNGGEAPCSFLLTVVG